MTEIKYILDKLNMKYLFINFFYSAYINLCKLNYKNFKYTLSFYNLSRSVFSFNIIDKILFILIDFYNNIFEVKLVTFLKFCLKYTDEIYLGIIIFAFCITIFLNLIYINKEKKYQITLVLFVISYSIFLNIFYFFVNINNILITDYVTHRAISSLVSLSDMYISNNYLFVAFTEEKILSIADYIIRSIITLSLIFWLLSYYSFIKEKLTLIIYGSFEIIIIYMLVIYLLYKLISSDNLITFVILLESQNLALCIICAYGIGNYLSRVEAALKLYITSAASTGFLLLGCGLMYGSTGSIYFNDFKIIMDQRYVEEFLRSIEQILLDLVNLGYIKESTWTIYSFCANGSNEANIYLFVVGTLCFFISFAFKLGQVPFHLWISDVYSGGSLLFVSFLAIFPKIAIGYYFIKIVAIYFCKDMLLLILLFISGIATILIGMLGALTKQKIKSFIAYSSIANIGYLILLSSLSYIVSSDIIVTLSIIFFINYILVMLQIFIGIFNHHYITNQKAGVKEVEFLSEISGLYKYNKINAIFLSVGFLALIGIPPVIGFIIKFYISSIILVNGLYYIGLLFLVLGVISTIYYLKIIKIIIFDKMNKNLYLLNNSIPNKISQFFIFISQILIFLKPLIIIIIILIMLF